MMWMLLAAGFALSIGVTSSERHLLMILVAALFSAALLRSRPLNRPQVVAASVFLWLLLATLWSTQPEASFFFSLMIGSAPLAYLLVMRESPTSLHWPSLWWGMAAAAAGAAALGVWEFLLAPGQRANGPFLDYNAYGALFNVFLLPAYARYAALPTGRGLAPRLLEALMALCLVVLLATYSRGAIGALMLLWPALALLIWWAGHRAVRPPAVFLGLAGLAYLLTHVLPAQVTDRPVLALGEDASTQARLMMWRSTLAAWQEHPWLGTGLSTFKLHYLRFRDPAETGSSGDLAHNDYLQFLLEGGPLLLLALLGTLGVTLWLAGRLIRQLRARNGAALPASKVEALGLLAALGALYLQATVNFIFYVLPLAMAAGLYLARVHQLVAPPRPITRPPPFSAGFRRLLLGGASAFLLGALALDGLAASLLQREQPPSWAQRWVATPQARYDTASLLAALRPHNLAAHTAMTEIMTQRALAPDVMFGPLWAQTAFEHALATLAICEGHPFSYLALGQLTQRYPALREQTIPALADAEPATLLARAIRNHPASPTGHLLLAEHLEATGDPAAAYRVLAAALPWSQVKMTSEDTLRRWETLFATTLRLADQQGARRHAAQLAPTVLQFDPDNDIARRVLRRAAGAASAETGS